MKVVYTNYNGESWRVSYYYKGTDTRPVKVHAERVEWLNGKQSEMGTCGQNCENVK
jgi:hypothetical protein